MKRYEITAEYEFHGQYRRCLCYEAGCAIVYGEETAKAQVEKLHEMGITSAAYAELPQGKAWFDDENWIG